MLQYCAKYPVTILLRIRRGRRKPPRFSGGAAEVPLINNEGTVRGNQSKTTFERLLIAAVFVAVSIR